MSIIYFPRIKAAFLLTVTLLTFVAGQRVEAQAILPPPFGLQWGDSPDKILDWAQAKKLDVNIKIPGQHPELRVLQVSAPKGALPGHKAFALEARYHWGKLYEVTLRYGAPGVSLKSLNKDFEKLKTSLTNQHGALKPNKAEKSRKGSVNRTARSYHIEPVAGLMLLLVHTEMEDTLKKVKSARFCLVYRNQNILPKK
ncbi:MAG: hypothetical protein ACPG32_05840 [Akkermansiaceae bacterium]